MSLRKKQQKMATAVERADCNFEAELLKLIQIVEQHRKTVYRYLEQNPDDCCARRAYRYYERLVCCLMKQYEERFDKLDDSL